MTTDALGLVRQALEKHLLGMDDPAFPTAMENGAFTPPAVATPYQRVNLLPATPDNQVAGSNLYREHGILQVTLMHQAGKGSKDQEQRLGLLRERFKRGTTLTEGGLQVVVTHTPAVAGGYQLGDRWARPVSIRWQAWVAS